MNIKKIKSEEKTTFSLSGTLDMVTAPKLQEVLIPEFERVKHVELDFKNLSYVASAGLRVLVTGEKTAKTKGCKQIIVNVPNRVMEVFKMTGFLNILSIE